MSTSMILINRIKKKINWLVARVLLEYRSPTTRLGLKIFKFPREIKDKIKFKKKNGEFLAIYDLQVCAVTFNFAEFLILAMEEARKKNYEKFFMAFIPRVRNPDLNYGEYNLIHDDLSQDWKFKEIIIPLVSCAESCSGFVVLSKREDINSLLANFGETYPSMYSSSYWERPKLTELNKVERGYLGLRAQSQAKRYIENWAKLFFKNKKIVTITIRDQKFDLARNSNIDSCVLFGEYLLERGYEVVIVPDTDSAWEKKDSFAKFYVFEAVAWNLNLKIALYEYCYLNFFVPNGSAALAYLNPKCSFVLMNFLPKNSIVTTEKALKAGGLEIGSQFRFSEPWQRIVWDEDSFENMKKTFIDFESKFPEWPLSKF